MRWRHQVATPIVTYDLTLMEAHLSKLRRDNPVVLKPASRWAIVQSYAGRWRVKYMEAYERFKADGLKPRHARVNMFVKDDLEMSVPEKAPRAIQYRDSVFALEQSRFTKPIEKWFYSLRDEYGTKIVGKADGFTIAKELVAKASKFNNPVFLMLDASKFDSCVDIAWIKLCTDFYVKLFPSEFAGYIRRLWRQTLINRGRTRKGLKFVTHGTRMSGDMDTSLGNSIVMFCMLKEFMRIKQVRHSILVNGDDSIVVISAQDLHKVKDMSPFKEFGFNMKFEFSRDIQRAEFCQSRLVYTDYGPTMARNPSRIMGRTSWTTRSYGPQTKAYIKTLGLCERAASYGVPIASEMANHMIAYGGEREKVYLGPWLEEWYRQNNRPWKIGPPTISMETRLSYCEAWGIDPARQIELENSITVRANMNDPAQAMEMEDLTVLGLVSTECESN